MGNHHKTKSPSSLPAKKECIHYESGEAGLPARKGSILHKCFEYAAAGKLIPNTWEKLEEADKKELLEGGVFEADFKELKDPDFAGIYWAVEELDDIIHNLYSEERSISELVAAGEAKLERKVSIYGPDFSEITFGSMDFDFSTLLVDLKTGEIRNYREQMLSYALAKMQETGLESVVVVELYSKKRKTVIYEVTREEAEREIFSLSDKIDNKDNFEPTLCDYCAWCKKRNSGECSVILERAALVQENRAGFPKEISYRSTELLSTTLAALQEFQEDPFNKAAKESLDNCAGDLAFLYDSAKAAKNFLSGVENSIKIAISNGVNIPGLKEKKSSGRGKITDAKKAFAISGLDQETFLSVVSISTGDLLNLIGNPATLTKVFENQNVPIPTEFKGKKNQLLKTKSSNALNHLLQEKGILERGADSISIARDKNNSSIRKGDSVPEELKQ